LDQLHLVDNVADAIEIARPVGHNHIVSALSDQHANDFGADKPGATSNQNAHTPSFAGQEHPRVSPVR
jgi:hypothetical protein